MNMDSRTTGRFRNLLARSRRGRCVSRTRNLSLFLILAAVWGSAFMAIKAGLTYFPAGVVRRAQVRRCRRRHARVRGVRRRRSDPAGTRRWTTVAVGATLIIAAYHAFLFIGESDPAVTSAVAAVIVSLSPVLTTVFARAFLPSERLTLVGVVGLLVGLAGAVVVLRRTRAISPAAARSRSCSSCWRPRRSRSARCSRGRPTTTSRSRRWRRGRCCWVPS